MLLLALCVLSGTEKLYGAPATFWDHLPIASLNVHASQGGSRTLRLLVDSGANLSVLFPSSASLPSGAELWAGHSELGACDFHQVGRGEMTADGARLMSRLGIDGAIGDDFLVTHDVLIDYRHQRIYFGSGQGPESPSRLVLSVPSGTVRISPHRIDLVQQDDRYFAPCTVDPGTACLMALDTGTGESSLPNEIASGLAKTGAVKSVAGFQGRTVRASEHFAKIAIGDHPPMTVKVLGNDQRGPILGGNAFEGRCLFLQLRASAASYW